VCVCVCVCVHSSICQWRHRGWITGDRDPPGDSVIVLQLIRWCIYCVRTAVSAGDSGETAHISHDCSGGTSVPWRSIIPRLRASLPVSCCICYCTSSVRVILRCFRQRPALWCGWNMAWRYHTKFHLHWCRGDGVWPRTEFLSKFYTQFWNLNTSRCTIVTRFSGLLGALCSVYW